MTTRIEMVRLTSLTEIDGISVNRLVSIVYRNCTTMLTTPCPYLSSSCSNVKHATSTAGHTVNEMGGSAREIVLDIVSEFGCRNDSGGIYKLTSFTLGYSTRKGTTK